METDGMESIEIKLYPCNVRCYIRIIYSLWAFILFLIMAICTKVYVIVLIGIPGLIISILFLLLYKIN